MLQRKKSVFESDTLLAFLRQADFEVTYMPADFSDSSAPQYATIELRTHILFQEHLVAEINARLNRDNGYCAALRVIDYATLPKQKMHYVVEIVPFETVARRDWGAATEQFLDSLPRTVRNVLMKK